MSDIMMAEAMPAIAPVAAQEARRNGCAHCGRPFGMVRHRIATKQLCSLPCVDAESDRMQQVLKEKVRRLAGRA